MKPQGPAPTWEEVPGSIAGSFGEVSQGLYVFTFRNPTGHEVLDNNKRKKVVVRRQGVSLKAGNFEQTLLARLSNFNAHLHRVLPEQAFQPASWDCFERGYVLDLSLGGGFPAARIFERYRVEAAFHFLRSGGHLEDEQIKRSEWRYVRQSGWSSESHDDLLRYLPEVGGRIQSMLKLGTFPSTQVRPPPA